MAALTVIHVLFSLAGIISGFVVIAGFLSSRSSRWTGFFLVTTVATSVTGFLFPVHKFMPSHAVGILSLLVLALAITALYRYRLAGRWRATFVTGAIAAQYLNVFVLVAQLFAKAPTLKALAPTQSEPPFAIAQLIVLLLFIWLGIKSARSFRPDAARSIAASVPSR